MQLIAQIMYFSVSGLKIAETLSNQKAQLRQRKIRRGEQETSVVFSPLKLQMKMIPRGFTPLLGSTTQRESLHSSQEDTPDAIKGGEISSRAAQQLQPCSDSNSKITTKNK
jgi:hypothetical protein